MRKKALSLLLVCFLIFTAIPVSAEANQAYAVLADEEPVYVESLSYKDIYGFFRDADTDRILDPSECNYTYGEVTVGGSAVLCHVYMRTFDITDASDYLQTDVPMLTQKTLRDVKDAVADKYLKCIAKTYYLRLSYVADELTGGIVSMTVKVFFACGEKTEDRAELKTGYIAPIAEELSALDMRDRFLSVNDLILDGRFSYDTGLNNRSSVVDFVKGGEGVCEEYAGFTSLLLDALGYENRIITGTVNGVPHMWNLVEADGRTYHLDILQDGPVDENGNHVSVNREYLLVSEETIEKTHTVSPFYKPLSSLAVYDYVFDGYPVAIGGTVEKNGVNYLPYTPRSITVSELCELLDGRGFIRIFAGDEQLGGEDAVRTGCTADIFVNGKTIDSCVISVEGDCGGDGAAGEDDLTEIISVIIENKAEEIPGEVFFAADMNRDGRVTVTDAVIAYDTVYKEVPDEEPEPPDMEVTGP